MKPKTFASLFACLVIICSCRQSRDTRWNAKPAEPDTVMPGQTKIKEAPKSFDEELALVKKFTTKDSVLSNDYDFIFDTLLKGKVRLDMSAYDKEAHAKKCFPIREKKTTLFEFQEGLHNLGDLDGDGKNDSVFVLFPLNYCEEGQSYYFTNGLPRILTDSGCCHPYSILNLGDIDEDGYCEIAQYYSSCASRYKHFKILSLKNKKWKEYDMIGFMLNDEYEQFKDFNKLFKKTAKNKLRCLEIYDTDVTGKLLTQSETITIQ